jgi:recombination protein RecR
LGFQQLLNRLKAGAIQELILATNATVEGDATAHYLYDICAQLPISITRIAHGVPLGGELEYVDGCTLAHSFSGRRSLR